jgi:hypothetical protein
MLQRDFQISNITNFISLVAAREISFTIFPRFFSKILLHIYTAGTLTDKEIIREMTV